MELVYNHLSPNKEDYNVSFEFGSKTETGQKILKLLIGEKNENI